MNHSQQIISWLRNHDLIKLNRLEKKCSLPQAYLHKAIKGIILLPDKHVEVLKTELNEYGLKLK